MTPSDRFYFLPNNQVSSDPRDLLTLYQPLMGDRALAVYQYLLAFFDNGRAAHPFTELLNHLQLDFVALKESLDVLGALGLIGFYQLDEDYLIRLYPALDRETFLANPVLRALLTSYIGEWSVSQLAVNLPEQAKELTKRFSEVFSDRGELYQPPKQAKSTFNMDSFRLLMGREGFRFETEQEPVLTLHRLADSHGFSWFDLYQRAKQTAIGQVLSMTRLEELLAQEAKDQPVGQLTPKESEALQAAKSHKPEDYLTLLKQLRQAQVTPGERQLLKSLANLGLLDEVINLAVLYTLKRTQSANLNKEFLTKLVNDLNFKQLRNGAEVLVYLRQPLAPKKPAKGTVVTKTNVPAWSQQDYKKETSQEEQERLAQLRQEMLAGSLGED